MGRNTNVCNAYNSAARVAWNEINRAKIGRYNRRKNTFTATEKQITYVNNIITFLESRGFTDYPNDSKWDTNEQRANTLLKLLNGYINRHGLRGEMDEWTKPNQISADKRND